MSVSQTDFLQALLDPGRSAPTGLVDPTGQPTQKRFDVYRNNVAVSLTEALATAFPVIRKLVGDEFFDAMAGVFLRTHPPTSPLIMFYGAEMPGFLAGFEPARDLGYLPDIARLEQALRQSYHAADAAPIDPEHLQAMPPDRLMTATLTLAPAVHVIRSDWPIYAIWTFNTQQNAPKPAMRAEDVLITRARFDPVPWLLPAGAADFIMSLQAGRTFGQALEKAGPEFDLTATLGLLLSGGGITKIIEGTPA